jgi:DNA-binding response OmpR family regulator
MGRRLVMRGEQTIVLSRLQHQLLMLLLARRGCVVPRSEIERALYGRPRRDASDASNTVAVCISQLRRKLGSNLIITIHGVGYSIPSFD